MPEIEKPSGAPVRRRDSGLLPAKGNIEQHAALYRVAYQEGQRTLDDQQDELNNVRNRAVGFTAFIGAATAFLVGTGLHVTNRDTVFYVLASVATACSIGYISLLWGLLNPRRGKLWHYRMQPKVLIADWIERDVPPPSEAHFMRALAETYDKWREDNEALLGSLRRCYRWLITAGAAQIILWAILVWVKG